MHKKETFNGFQICCTLKKGIEQNFRFNSQKNKIRTGMTMPLNKK